MSNDGSATSVTDESTSTNSTSPTTVVDPSLISPISSAPDLASLNVLKQGAEGRIYLTSNKYSSRCIIKERFAKQYRHPTLDYKLTKHRINSEVRCLAKVQAAGVHTPQVYHTDVPKKEHKKAARAHPYRGMRIYMQYIDGITVKEWLWGKNLLDATDSAEAEALASRIGKAVALMHQAGVVHGDLTTSNLILASRPVTSATSASTPTCTSSSTSTSSSTATDTTTIPSTTTVTADPISTSVTSSVTLEHKETHVTSSSTLPTAERPLYVIDFGLSSVSSNIEDKAVDLYVLERALLSTHHNSEHLVTSQQQLQSTPHSITEQGTRAE